MIDTSIVRVHQHAGLRRSQQETVNGAVARWTDRKIHAVVDGNGLPGRLALTTGEAHDNQLAAKLLSRLKSGSMLLANRDYDTDWIRALAPSTAPGRISRRKEIGQRRFASARIFTELEIWSSGSSTRSSIVGVSQPATTNSQPTTSHSFSSRQYGCGCALMSPRPNLILIIVTILVFRAATGNAEKIFAVAHIVPPLAAFLHLMERPLTPARCRYINPTQESYMDREHVKGAADKAKGAIEDAAGKVTGDKELQTEGKLDKAKGDAHNLAGDLKDAVRKGKE